MGWRESMKSWDDRLLFRLRNFGTSMSVVGERDYYLANGFTNDEMWQHHYGEALSNAQRHWRDLLEVLDIDMAAVPSELVPMQDIPVDGRKMKDFNERMLLRILRFGDAMRETGKEERSINDGRDSFHVWQFASKAKLKKVWETWSKVVTSLNIVPSKVLDPLRPHTAHWAVEAKENQ